jgi:hypothetical protein
MRGEHQRKSTSDREGSQYRNVEVASGTKSKELLRVVKEKNQNLCMYFSLLPGGLKI